MLNFQKKIINDLSAILQDVLDVVQFGYYIDDVRGSSMRARLIEIRKEINEKGQTKKHKRVQGKNTEKPKT